MNNDKLINEVNKISGITEQLETIESKKNNELNIYISNFKRQPSEDDDSIRIQRAIDYLNSKGGGILNLEYGVRYYLKYKQEDSCFIKTYPNISIEGNNAILYVDSMSENSMSGMIKCLNIQNATYKNIIFDTSLINIIDDKSFYDCFYLRYTPNGNINVHFYGIKTVGKAYQTPINFSSFNSDIGVEKNSGYNVSLKNCEFFQTSYPTCINNLSYENVTWNMDLDAKRPAWNDGQAQTPFKFSARGGFNRNITMKNCTINVEGERNPLTLFEVSRCEVEIDKLNINIKSPNVKTWFNIMSTSSKPQYGVCNLETKLIIKNCDFSKVSCYYGELSNVFIDKCIFGNNNAIYSLYKANEKQTTNDDGSGKIKINNSYFKDICGRITVDDGDTFVTIQNSIIEYDKAKSPNNGITLSNNSVLEMYNNTIILNGEATYLFFFNNSKRVLIDGLNYLQGTFNGVVSDYSMTLNGNIGSLILKNYNNPYKSIGKPFYRGGTIGYKDICNERLLLNENYVDYEIKIVGGQLTATRLS